MREDEREGEREGEKEGESEGERKREGRQRETEGESVRERERMSPVGKPELDVRRACFRDELGRGIAAAVTSHLMWQGHYDAT